MAQKPIEKETEIQVQENDNASIAIAEFKVFGSRPKNAIFLLQTPYGVRNDCKSGYWKVGEDDFRGKEIEISILKVNQFFGSLGKTKNTFWQQIWFIAAPTCKIIPNDTVCVTYLKKRSITQLSEKITELSQEGEPALGIFKGFFSKHNGENGDYYSVVWGWRKRESPEEIQQLNMIADFMAGQPTLLDLSVDLLPIDGLSTEEIQALMASAKSEESQLTTIAK